MNGQIIPISHRKTPAPETIQARIAHDLIHGNQVDTGDRTHSFDDVLQHLWGNVDDSNDVESALQSIAMGGGERSMDVIRKALLRAAEEYALTIVHDVLRVEMAEADMLAAEQYHFAENYHL